MTSIHTPHHRLVSAHVGPIARWLGTASPPVLRLIAWAVGVAVVALVGLAATQPPTITLPLVLVLLIAALIGALAARVEREGPRDTRSPRGRPAGGHAPTPSSAEGTC